MFDTDKFICEVESRPALYNVKLKDYSNRETKAKCWAEIGMAMFKDWNDKTEEEKNIKGKELMKKWKTLRDNFVRDYRIQSETKSGEPASKKKRYIYFDQLLFLIPIISEGKERTTNILPISDDSEVIHDNPGTNDAIHDEDAGNISQGTKVIEGDGTVFTGKNIMKSRSRKPPKSDNILLSATMRFTDILQESISLQRDERTSDRFGNKPFLQSFVPVLDNLPHHLQIKARLKIAEVIDGLISGNSASATHDWTYPQSETPYVSDSSHLKTMEQLIEEVRKYPCIYDMTTEGYRDNTMRDNCWEAIARSLQKDCRSIKYDWKRLRDSFCQALARQKTISGQAAKSRKPWRYENQMKFLIPFMFSRETSTNIEDVQIAEEEDCDSNEPMTPEMQVPVSAVPSTSNEDVFPAKRKCPHITDVEKVINYFQEKKGSPAKKDDLDLFFMSACQSTKALTRRMQNKVKKDILEILVRAEEQEEMETFEYIPSPFPSPCEDT
ncbi:uncharacterized protein LOC135202078 [Macrobrachium nipponense]|uniref:uncharacterized protein LOC135202078 n=1 Tax=Macrobrachium nipponense TaxID=159736 RepID=UPI0030C852C4